MKKITMKIDGMKCGMCETHVNNCVRTNFEVKSVKSSHLKKRNRNYSRKRRERGGIEKRHRKNGL